jgi:hypothetical protein
MVLEYPGLFVLDNLTFGRGGPRGRFEEKHDSLITSGLVGVISNPRNRSQALTGLFRAHLLLAYVFF